MKNIRYFFEAALVWSFFMLFRAMPVDRASALGGWIGRTIGPRLGASRKALENMHAALPGKTPEEYAKILHDMWENLGRVTAEYPHLQYIILNRCEMIGEEHLRALPPNMPCVFIGAHVGNWELPAFCFNYKLKWPVSCVYREPNNPYVVKLLENCRNPEQRGAYIPKSKRGAREIIKTLKRNESIAILIDQKYNQGIPVDFFGRPAMTSVAFAQLAKNYDCPLMALQVERLEGCNFRLTLCPPFETKGRDEKDIALQAHALIEEWIIKRPAQWLWLHRRWNSRALKNLP